MLQFPFFHHGVYSVARAVLAREELLKLLQYVRSYNCFGITSVLNDTVYVQEIFRVTYTRCVNKFVQTGIDFRNAGDWTVLLFAKEGSNLVSSPDARSFPIPRARGNERASGDETRSNLGQT